MEQTKAGVVVINRILYHEITTKGSTLARSSGCP